MRRIVVERGRFALPKTHKSHIRHEPDAQLSTSTITGSSPLVSLKYLCKVRCFPLKNFFMVFSSSSYNA